MSLTSMLDDARGPLRAWWDSELPLIKSFIRQGLWKGDLAAAPSASASNGASLVGTALDYRVRWLWPHVEATDLIGVRQGAVRQFGPARAKSFAAEVDDVAGPLAGATSWDAVGTDDWLARLALVLAHLEAVYRIGRPVDPTAGVRADMPLAAMMDAQRGDLVDDIRGVLAAGRRLLEPMLSGAAILNPGFNLSHLFGGADADFVVDACLVELKSTRRASMDSNELRQLVTYVLLDDIDEHKIREVSLFYIRRPQLLTWQVDELLREAGSNRSRAELSASLIEALPTPR